MIPPFYEELSRKGMAQERIPPEEAARILDAGDIEILPLVNAAYTVRKKWVGNSVSIHILNNAQNGYCPEDCHYCAQAKSSEASIEEYPMKSDEEILKEAESAYLKGAFRYCMVFAGRGPSQGRVEHLARLIRSIKARYPIEVCVSAGIIDEAKARTLKGAGLDRLNHNLNTSAGHYHNICTTHAYDDRLQTMQAAQRAGLQLCSGVIIGMGETTRDIIEVAYTLRGLNVASIPINFFMPIPGTKLKIKPSFAPEYCLRVLCLFRLINPTAEIRIGAGRELYLRDMQSLALYPANSLFIEGYLNARGDTARQTIQMIVDAGFMIESELPFNELLKGPAAPSPDPAEAGDSRLLLKRLSDLRPQLQK